VRLCLALGKPNPPRARCRVTAAKTNQAHRAIHEPSSRRSGLVQPVDAAVRRSNPESVADSGLAGIWAFKRPFAAMGMVLWLVALPFLLVGVFTIQFALGFHACLALPFAGIPLVVALVSGLAGYKVIKANGEFSNRAILPGLAGLFALALIGALTLSALRWPDSSSPRPPDKNRPSRRPVAKRPNGLVPRRVNVPARPTANSPPVETGPSAAPDPTGTAR
jgi:hypothetical protein